MIILLTNVNNRGRQCLSQLFNQGFAQEVDYDCVQICNIFKLESYPGFIIMEDEFNFVAISRKDFEAMYIEEA